LGAEGAFHQGGRLAPDPGNGAGAAVPTQRGRVWSGGDSATGPVRQGRTLMLKVALVLVPALLVIAAVAGYLGLREGERSSGRATGPATAGGPTHKPTNGASQAPPSPASPAPPSASASPSDEGTPSPSATSSPSPTTSKPADAPDGWHRYKDSTGFSIALPKGWSAYKRSGTAVYFHGPGTSGFLLIDQTSSPRKDAKKDWENQERARRSTFADYKRVKIESVDYWDEAADWEFTFASGSGRQHVVNRGFVTDKHHGYAIYWSTPSSSWDEDHHYFETFTATFKPAK
ncbi:hypothetical protein MPTA5024_09135, partial [Microbispora sp. ATCC PTA-5024]